MTTMFEPETVWEFSTANRIKFGTAAAEELPAELDRFGASSVVLVTDPGLVESGIVDELLAGFSASVDVEVFADVEPDPSIDVYEQSITFASEVNPDAIVGVGGGSSMDVAKTTGILLGHDNEILDFVAEPTGRGKPVPGPGRPTICLPTTAGTGSETSPVSVISLPERNMKVGLSSRHQYPELALVDPTLAVTLPPYPTATSGIDALCHAIEAYVTRRYDAKARPESAFDRPDYNGRSVVTDQLARAAISHISGNLRRAVNNGEDLTARRNMALGSLLAGAAFTNAGLGIAHALAMAIGAEQHTAHGATIAAVLPAVMRFNRPSSFERFGEIAELMDHGNDGPSDREAAEVAPEMVQQLVDDVGLGGGLTGLGVVQDDVPTLAEKSYELQRLVVGNPRRVTEDDLVTVIENAL